MASPQRYDIYRLIHKGLRAFLTDTLVLVGRLDAGNLIEIAQTCAQVKALLAFCQAHLDKENTYVHPALADCAAPALSTVIEDHQHHQQDIASLYGRVEDVLSADRTDRDAAIHTLYLDLSVFVAENLTHMYQEEIRINAALWQRYTDAEIIAIEQKIVASIPPQDQAPVFRWMIPAATPEERAEFMNGVRAAVPSDVFAGLRALVSPYMPPRDMMALDQALGLIESSNIGRL